MRSIGESNTRCSAMVSSTTPRLGPRWPLVLDTTSMRMSRISEASSGSCSGLSFFRSWGPLIDSRRANCLLPRTTARRFPRSLFGPAQRHVQAVTLARMQTLVVDHPLVAHKLTALRDSGTEAPMFRRLADELVTLLAYEANRELRVQTVSVT